MEDKKEKIPTPWELFHIECGKGWESLYKPIFEYIENYNKDKNDKDKIVITQVKEKWGGLRIYTNFHTDELFDMICNAEKESYNICEECGSRKDIGYTKGWIQTICYDCIKKRVTVGQNVVGWTRQSDKKSYWIYPDKDELINVKDIEQC